MCGNSRERGDGPGLHRGAGIPLSARGREAVSLRSGAGPSVRASRARSLCAVWIVLTLSACSPAVGPSAPPSQPVVGLPVSSWGVCRAIAALPDESAAERAFTNLAHEALHGLAADPRLDRSTSARVLEAMARVEADFREFARVSVMTSHLMELHAAADAALQALSLEVPACPK